MDKYVILNESDAFHSSYNRRLLYMFEDKLYDISIKYLKPKKSDIADIQRNNIIKIENGQMLSEVLEISKRIGIGKDSREFTCITNVDLLTQIECNDGYGNKVNALGIDIDDEDFSILYVQSVCNKNLILFEENIIEDNCFEDNCLKLCSVCKTPHKEVNMVEIDDDSNMLACADCIDDEKIVRCNCIHHYKDNYYILREDATYEDEEGNFYCEAYNDDGGLTDFEDADDYNDFYEDFNDK